MVLKISGSLVSQPTRAVVWTCDLLKLPRSFVDMKTAKGDHLASDYVAKNPNAKFPLLEDGSAFSLWESNAIMRYVAQRYAPTSDLYPTSPETRSRVDQWLDWKHTLRVGSAGVVRRHALALIVKDISKHSMRFDLVEIPGEREVRILNDCLNILEAEFATKGPFIAGTTTPTLADIAVFEELEQFVLFPANQPPPFGCDFSRSYPSIHVWLSKMRLLDGYEEVHRPLLNLTVKTRNAIAAKKQIKSSL